MFRLLARLALALALLLVSMSVVESVSASHLQPAGRLWTYYAFGRPAGMAVWNLATDSLTTTFVPRPGNGRAVAFDPTDGNIWVAALNSVYGEGFIYKYPPMGGGVITSIPDPGGVNGPGIGALDYDAEENVLWATSYQPVGNGSRLYKLNPANGAVLATCQAPFHPESGLGNDTLAIARPADLGGKKVLLTDGGELLNTLYAIDASTCAILKTYNLPVPVSGIDVADDSGEMIAATFLSAPVVNGYESILYNLGAAPYNTIQSQFTTPKIADGDAIEDISLESHATTRQVSIDIKPGSSTNPINLKAKGVIPVAILSSATFDATQVVVSSVCFGDAENASQRDCTEAHGKGHPEDVNGDGRPDLVFHFNTQQTGIDAGDTQACLTGETKGGEAIQGCDTIQTK